MLMRELINLFSEYLLMKLVNSWRHMKQASNQEVILGVLQLGVRTANLQLENNSLNLSRLNDMH